MNRREFVTASLAAGAAVAIPMVAIAAEPKGAIFAPVPRFQFPMHGMFFAGPVPRDDVMPGDVWHNTTDGRNYLCIATEAVWSDVDPYVACSAKWQQLNGGGWPR